MFIIHVSTIREHKNIKGLIFWEDVYCPVVPWLRYFPKRRFCIGPTQLLLPTSSSSLLLPCSPARQYYAIYDSAKWCQTNITLYRSTIKFSAFLKETLPLHISRTIPSQGREIRASYVRNYEWTEIKTRAAIWVLVKPSLWKNDRHSLRGIYQVYRSSIHLCRYTPESLCFQINCMVLS